MRIRPFLMVLLLVPVGFADTVILENGLEVSGAVAERDGTVEVAFGGKTRVFPRDRVKEIRKGESPVEEFARRAAALPAEDAAGWYRLGLWAREHGLATAREALDRVVAIDPDHRAARRELGFERIDGAWVSGDDAMRRKGFVLAGGRWLLPAEADRLMREGLMEQAPVTDEHRKAAREAVEALKDDDEEIRGAAREMVDGLPDAAVLDPMKKLLLDAHADTRLFAVQTLARTRDKTALPFLIRSSMYDANEDVRNAAFRAIKGFGDADVFYPYARATLSNDALASVQGAKALAALGDLRGVDVILRKVSIALGASGRANIMVGTQNSYIQDFDVEIAQAAAIGDPIVQTIRDGIILDVKVLGGYGEGWIVQQRGAYAAALQDITGRDFGQDWKAWRRYADEQGYPRVSVK
ncbi:MAG TPA: HEAT repeat domain-containing protein [Planctomycetota bacterium]|nr:HEAT repeat domain-containing protein [Planctomycetota bacterium]